MGHRPFLDPLLHAIHSLITTSRPPSSPSQMLQHQQFFNFIKTLVLVSPFLMISHFPPSLRFLFTQLRFYHRFLDLVAGPFLYSFVLPKWVYSFHLFWMASQYSLVYRHHPNFTEAQTCVFTEYLPKLEVLLHFSHFILSLTQSTNKIHLFHL